MKSRNENFELMNAPRDYSKSETGWQYDEHIGHLDKKERSMEIGSSKNHNEQPIFAVISGEIGVGKTTFGAEFPDPLFVLFEDGMRSLSHKDIPCTPLITSSDQLKQVFDHVKKVTAKYKTIVFDSSTALEEMLVKEIITEYNASNLNTAAGGYGAGSRILGNKFSSIINSFLEVTKSNNQHFVVIAHSTLEEHKSEDSEPFTKLVINSEKKTKTSLTALSDVIGFIRLVKQVSKTKDGKGHIATSDNGERELICYKIPSIEAKNRLGITSPLILTPGTNPLLNKEDQEVKKADSKAGSNFFS